MQIHRLPGPTLQQPRGFCKVEIFAAALHTQQPCTQPHSHATQQSRTPAATHVVIPYLEYIFLYSTYENTAFIFCNSPAATQHRSHASTAATQHSSHATQQPRNTAVPQPRSTHFKIRHTFSRVEYYQLYSTCEKAAIANQLDHRPTVLLLGGHVS